MKSLLELPAIFPSPPSEPIIQDESAFAPSRVMDVLGATEVDDSFSAPPAEPVFIGVDLASGPDMTAYLDPAMQKPKKVLSKAHLAALKAGREAKARAK